MNKVACASNGVFLQLIHSTIAPIHVVLIFAKVMLIFNMRFRSSSLSIGQELDSYIATHGPFRNVMYVGDGKVSKHCIRYNGV